MPWVLPSRVSVTRAVRPLDVHGHLEPDPSLTLSGTSCLTGSVAKKLPLFVFSFVSCDAVIGGGEKSERFDSIGHLEPDPSTTFSGTSCLTGSVAMIDSSALDSSSCLTNRASLTGSED